MTKIVVHGARQPLNVPVFLTNIKYVYIYTENVFIHAVLLFF